MPVKTVNPDIQRERDKCSFVPAELTYLLDGDENKTKERRAREEFFLSDPELQDKIPSDYLSHKEKYEEAVRKACIVLKKIQYLQEQENTGVENYREVLGGMLGSALTRDGSPIALHYVMFVPTLMGQGTVTQQAEWIGRAWSCNIIGTYAQTELGHGTFIRGLETTATYDAKNKEFILNSPTITSYKWWPGGLGQTANYAIVVAQLHTQGECHGIHPFIVQLRDEDTHMPMPGIKIGEIGVKLGMNSTNNGYLGFDNVHIPREHMLMKNAKVLEDGTYVKSPSSKLTYGTMVFVRVVIVQDVANQLSKAVTIAIRYSAVRRQSQPKPDEAEPQIMDYVTQQHKLFPALAASFAFKFSAGWIWDMYNNVIGELDAGDLDRLPELHALTCCLKAVSTSEAARYIEQCRLSCGGHGYMTCSSLPTIYGLVTAACTYEGENTVLFLQTARFLMKAFQQAGSGASMTPTVRYLSELTSESKWVNNVAGIVEGLKRVALGKINSCAKVLDQRVKDGISYEDAWNMTSIQLVAAAKAHCGSFVLETFVKETDRIFSKATRALRNVMNILVELFAVNAALEARGDLLMFTKITGSDITILQRREETLLAKIRPDAVGIADAFDIRDEILGSALGAYDGRVYERLMEEAAKSPLNSEPVNKSFNMYLKPLMKSQL